MRNPGTPWHPKRKVGAMFATGGGGGLSASQAALGPTCQ